MQREITLEQVDSEMRDGQLAPDFKAGLGQPAADGARVKVEIQGGEFDRLERKGAPRLAAQQVTGD